MFTCVPEERVWTVCVPEKRAMTVYVPMERQTIGSVPEERLTVWRDSSETSGMSCPDKTACCVGTAVAARKHRLVLNVRTPIVLANVKREFALDKECVKNAPNPANAPAKLGTLESVIAIPCCLIRFLRENPQRASEQCGTGRAGLQRTCLLTRSATSKLALA